MRDLTPRQREVRDQILENDEPADYEPSAGCLCRRIAGDALLADIDRHGIPSRQVLCTACGLIRLSPRWREDRYRRFYEHEYRPLYNPLLASPSELALRTAAGRSARGIGLWVSEVHSRRKRPGRPVVVEVGAGAGWNLAHLSTSWERIGYDVDRSYLEVGARLFGISAKWGYLDEALGDIERADLILLSHLLEHLLDPEDALQRIRAAMREDALLLIEVPGIFRIHRSTLDVMAYMQNAHVYTYCAETLRATCARAGFDVVELDETARAVCRIPPTGGSPVEFEPEPRLAEMVLRYLRLCERGYATLLRVRDIRLVGRWWAYAWRKLYFPWLRFATRRPAAASASDPPEPLDGA